MRDKILDKLKNLQEQATAEEKKKQEAQAEAQATFEGRCEALAELAKSWKAEDIISPKYGDSGVPFAGFNIAGVYCALEQRSPSSVVATVAGQDIGTFTVPPEGDYPAEDIEEKISEAIALMALNGKITVEVPPAKKTSHRKTEEGSNT